MRKLLVVFVVAAVVLAGAIAAQGCGDKLLALGRGVRFARAYKAPHPASILLFERADGSKGSAKAEAALASLLQQAGHSVSVSRTPEEVQKTVQARPVDLVMLSANDAEAIGAMLRALPARPTLVPVLYKPKKTDLAATEQRYHWAIAAPANPGPLLATIDAAVQSRLSQDARSRN
jgi:hypothetical protein